MISAGRRFRRYRLLLLCGLLSLDFMVWAQATETQDSFAMEDQKRNQYVISTDPSKLDLEMIHTFLTGSYWSKGITKEAVARSLDHSLCFGLYDETHQVGFARVITDYATFAYLCDVFVLESHRKQGLSKWLVEVIKNNPEVKDIPVWFLATRDAHGLYSQFGFIPLSHPSFYMQIYHPREQRF